MKVIYWFTEKAMKVNHEYKVYQVYENGLIPTQDYHSTDLIIDLKDTDIERFINNLEKQGYIHA